jgi:hypothetical protein
MKPKTLKHCADLIEKEVSYFNGWAVSHTDVRASCEIATKKIIRYLEDKGIILRDGKKGTSTKDSDGD